jgi:hypothetical protein
MAQSFPALTDKPRRASILAGAADASCNMRMKRLTQALSMIGSPKRYGRKAWLYLK